MMINIRKIVLLSTFLMSASSISAPLYAMDVDEHRQASRVIYRSIPDQLTPDMIHDIRQRGSFFALKSGSGMPTEYVLQNPEKFERFASRLNSDRYDSQLSEKPTIDTNDDALSPNFTPPLLPYRQSYDRDDTNLTMPLHNYIIEESANFRHPNPHYNPNRPNGMFEMLKTSHVRSSVRLTFKERGPADPAPLKPLDVEQESEPVAARPLFSLAILREVTSPRISASVEKPWWKFW